MVAYFTVQIWMKQSLTIFLWYRYLFFEKTYLKSSYWVNNAVLPTKIWFIKFSKYLKRNSGHSKRLLINRIQNVIESYIRNLKQGNGGLLLGTLWWLRRGIYNLWMQLINTFITRSGTGCLIVHSCAGTTFRDSPVIPNSRTVRERTKHVRSDLVYLVNE